ncbi:hypothetical protein OFN94_29225, partial [Escherichia coli]|nr:hypothetical protein [Escherichia coli]
SLHPSPRRSFALLFPSPPLSLGLRLGARPLALAGLISLPSFLEKMKTKSQEHLNVFFGVYL